MTYDKILDALGDPTRRLIFNRLRSGARSVAALSDGLPVSRPAVSQHLKILKQAGLVADISRGAQRIYRVDHDGLAGLQAWLDQLRDEALEAYRDEVQRQIDERKNT
jgi:DNA-binding transcriptional ArsR family regulator